MASDRVEAEDVFRDSEAHQELARQLFARSVALDPDGPGGLYLTQSRGLPAEVVADAGLGYLPPPIEGRSPLDHAAVAVLRDGKGEATGIECSFCDILGAPTATAPKRQTYALREHGVRDGLARYGAAGETAYMAEGYLSKPLALVAAGLQPAYGGGAASVLGFGIPAEKTAVIVPDRAPEDPTLAEKHRRSYQAAVDRLILAGRTVGMAPEPACSCPCKDSDDVLRAHGPEALADLVAKAAPVELSLDGHARQLARIRDPLERDVAITGRAKELGTRVAVLRQAVIRYLPEQEAAESEDTGTGRALDLPEREPWHEAVAGAALLEEVVTAIHEYVVLAPAQADAAALWETHAHALDCSWFNPRLALRSPAPRCGKTTLLEILGAMAPRPLPTANISPAAIFRTIDAAKPTLLIDEGDTFLGAEKNGDTRGILNAGHTPMAKIVRIVPTAEGELEPREFSVWAPIVVALIGKMPGPMADRSIKIELQRKPRGHRVKRLRQDRMKRFHVLGRKIARWVQDHAHKLREADPEPPEALHDRAADNWRPLFAIAEVAGGNWPARVQAAAIEIEGAMRLEEEEDRKIQLLADIQGVFETRAEDALWTDDLLVALIEMAERPWCEANRGKPLTARGLANLLRPFGVTSRQIKMKGVNRHGYDVVQFKGPFSRYLSATAATGLKTNGFPDSQDATGSGRVADGDLGKANDFNEVTGVADRNVGGGPSHANGADLEAEDPFAETFVFLDDEDGDAPDIPWEAP